MIGRVWRQCGALILLAALWVVLQPVLPSRTPLGIVLLGIVTGCLNALFAAGLVLVYKSSRVINFAQGNVGGLAAVLTVLLVFRGWNYYLALAAGLAAGVLVAGLIEVGLVRRMAGSPRLLVTVLTIGAAQVLGFAALILPTAFGETVLPGEFHTPLSGLSFDVFPVAFDGNYVLVVGFAVAAAAGLSWLLGRTRFGIGVRASAEHGDRAALCGVPVKSLATGVWIIGGFLASVAAILQAPVVGLPIGALVGPGLLLRGLAAAVLGRMTSLPVTMSAAVLLSLLEQSVLWAYGSSASVDVALMGIILVGLLFQRPTAERVDASLSASALVGEVRAVPAQLRALAEVRLMRALLMLVVAAVVLAAPWVLSTNRRDLVSVILIWAIVGLSLVVLTGWAGQISLGQFGIVGMGAAVTASFVVNLHVDFWLILATASAVGAAVAFLLGLPALRLSGLFLAVTTLAFGDVASSFVLTRDWVAPATIVPRTVLFGRIDTADDITEYYFVLTVLVVLIFVLRRVRSSGIGRAIVAVRDNEAMAQSVGISGVRTKLVAFALSGAIAGLAGALLVNHEQQLIAAQYSPDASISALAMTVVGGLGSIPGALLGATFIQGSQELLSSPYNLLGSGLGVVVILLVWPRGLGAAGFSVRDGLLRLVARRRGMAASGLLGGRRDEPDSGGPAAEGGLLVAAGSTEEP